jgi:methylated-DNA-[protein]-cysteine S-methyltransferase
LKTLTQIETMKTTEEHEMSDLDFDQVASPIGAIALVSRRGALCALDFADRHERMHDRLEARFGSVRLREVDDAGGHSSRLRAYLAGELDAFRGLRVETGGTDFQRQVWSALRRVRCGETRSYAEIANAIGRPGAARAVGSANARNPIALVIPCHRVVASDRGLGGYAGGLDRKRWLLAHEGAALC